MKEHSDIENISRLIIKSLVGQLTPAEKEELAGWRARSPEHDALCRKLERGETWTQQQAEFRVWQQRDGWSSICGKIAVRQRRRLVVRLCRYAAVAVLLLSVGYYLMQRPADRIAGSGVETAAVILPGGSKAVLHLADGREVVLEKAEETDLLREQGIVSREGALDYGGLVQTTAEQHELQVPAGGEYGLILADGTRVWLNSATVLRYPASFAGDRREVELLGEAYFKVAKDRTRPFIVKTGSMEITVTGTEFNVQAYADENTMATTLVEGSVMVKGNRGGVRLMPGEQACYDRESGHMYTRQVETGMYTSWKDGLFEFRDMPLGEIARQLARWYDVRIGFGDPEIADIHFTGALKKEKSLEFILGVIAQTQSIGYVIEGKTVILKKK